MGNDLTQSELKEILNYNETTGVFVWRRSAGRAKPNKPAGTDDGKGYTQISIDRKVYYAHRLAWFYVYGTFPTNEIDHKNGVRSDNPISNLREATHAENLMNLGMTKTNKSGYAGVSWSKKHQKWWAQIRISNKHSSLGFFDDIIEASNAYKQADLLRGDFSRQNTVRHL